MTLLSATVLLLLVTDPLGNVPLFITALKGIERSRQVFIIIREIFFAFIILSIFLFFGKHLLGILHLAESSLQLAGGIILFLIAIRMIFPVPHGMFGDLPDGEPFIFPLAVPLFAGPSAVATVLLFASKEPSRLGVWFLALLLCCLISGVILGFSSVMVRVIGTRGLNAFEKLMGLLLAAIAVQMIVTGIKVVFAA